MWKYTRKQFGEQSTTEFESYDEAFGVACGDVLSGSATPVCLEGDGRSESLDDICASLGRHARLGGADMRPLRFKLDRHHRPMNDAERQVREEKSKRRRRGELPERVKREREGRKEGR